MARFARIVVPGVPHHVTQRGTRRMKVFYTDSDYRHYIELLAERARKHDLTVWTYCLMPNHVHMIAVPASEQGLARPIGETHYRYARDVNSRHGWAGHLWQERFASFPMDERHALAAVRYVLLNPVRAGLASKAADWPWSSARAHLLRETDPLIDPAACSQRIENWHRFLSDETTLRTETDDLKRSRQIGRPLGSPDFITEIERSTGRRLRPQKVGRKPKRRRVRNE